MAESGAPGSPDSVHSGEQGGGGGGGEQSSGSAPREQDRYLPIANISRIMKKVVPPNGKISKEAKDIVQECVSEFISFITSEYVNRSTALYSVVLVVIIVLQFYF